jgi:hypothetical protein
MEIIGRLDLWYCLGSFSGIQGFRGEEGGMRGEGDLEI